MCAADSVTWLAPIAFSLLPSAYFVYYHWRNDVACLNYYLLRGCWHHFWNQLLAKLNFQVVYVLLVGLKTPLLLLLLLSIVSLRSSIAKTLCSNYSRNFIYYVTFHFEKLLETRNTHVQQRIPSSSIEFILSELLETLLQETKSWNDPIFIYYTFLTLKSCSFGTTSLLLSLFSWIHF